MTNYEDYEKPILIAMLKGKDKTVVNRNRKIHGLQKEIMNLKKEYGLQEDGFIDTPSLNIICFDENGRPNCSEHGAMNCFEFKIYRCIACGVVVDLNGKKVIEDGKQGEEA